MENQSWGFWEFPNEAKMVSLVKKTLMLRIHQLEDK